MPHTLAKPDVIAHLKWRYAVKKFAPEKRISAEDWAMLEQAVLLSPSSYGLQPWRFIVVTDTNIRRELIDASFGQDKVLNSSHLIVFAARKDITEVNIREWVNRLQDVRDLPDESADKHYKTIMEDLVKGPRSAHVDFWAKQQTYLALGVFLTAAAMLNIDACPMEGVDAEAYDRILQLSDQGFTTAVIATAGYRSENDTTSRLPKVRFPKEDVIKRI
jgi:nitroreductase